MLEQARDFLEECAALDALLRDLRADDWTRATQFKAWTPEMIVGHLHLFDYAAAVTLDSADAVRALFAQIQAGGADGGNHLDFQCEWLKGCHGDALRKRWFATASELAPRYGTADPSRRVTWGGPDMSVRSCISARQMETWSHGQAIFDLVGRERVEHDRLRNIAVIGVNTFGWTFVNRKLPVPDVRPAVWLRAPSGAEWAWPAAPAGNDAERIDGSAVDFCRVVTQTRSVADTTLQASGPIGRQWLSIAQCFAGAPHDPPAPGTRFRENA
jgi:uncharacterized protein (TIGR03084 family)